MCYTTLRTTLICVLLLMCAVAGSARAAEEELPELVGVDPVLEEPLRDVSVCRGPEDAYYLTGTSPSRNPDGTLDWHNNDGIHLWRSGDLRDWQPLGKVFDITGSLVDTGRRLRWLRKLQIVPGAPEVGRARGVQAPEVHYMRDTFWICFSMNRQGTGLLRSTTGQAEGPYEFHARVTTRGGDASMFEDDDGAVYWLFDEGWIARMEDDLSGLAERPRLLQPGPQGHLEDWPLEMGSGGTFLFKRDDIYYLMAAERHARLGVPCHDTFVAWSKDIYGPYSRRVVSVAHGGHTTVFRDGEGSYYATMSGNDSRARFRDRPAVVPLEWADAVNYLGHTGAPVPVKPRHVITERGPWPAMQPVSRIRMRDVQATLGPDGFVYLTGSFVNKDSEGKLYIFKSRDMVNWQKIVVWDWDRQEELFAEPFPDPRESKRPNVFTYMDTEIHYLKDTFYIAYHVYGGKAIEGGRGFLLKSTTGKAEGPYEPVVGAEVRSQPSFFVDDDGTIYHTYGAFGISPMKPDMSGAEPGGHHILPADGSDANDDTGTCFVKMKGEYVQFVTEWNGPSTLGLEGPAGGRFFATYDYIYYYSDELFGAYSTPRVGVPHGGHGSVFRDRLGNWWATMFGNENFSPWGGMPGVIPLKVDMVGGELLIDVADEGELKRRRQALRE